MGCGPVSVTDRIHAKSRPDVVSRASFIRFMVSAYDFSLFLWHSM